MKKMNFKIKTAVIILSLVIAVITATVAFGADNDPLVTLSYINETVIPKITEDVKNAVLAIIDQREDQSSDTSKVPEEQPSDTVDGSEEKPADTDPKDGEQPAEPSVPVVTPNDLSSLKYKVVYLVKGQKLYATGESNESTEVILRSGSVLCISPFGDQGIADLTASKELYNNDPLVKNNYCLIPRGGDGRGIYAVSSDAYILVRGEYEIVQE